MRTEDDEGRCLHRYSIAVLRFAIFFSSIGHFAPDRFAVSKTKSYSGHCSAGPARCESFIASGASQCQISARSSASLGKKWMFNTLRLLELYLGMKCWRGLQSHT